MQRRVSDLRPIGQVAGSKKIYEKHVESVRNLYFHRLDDYVELPYQVLVERNYHGILLRKETEKKGENDCLF